MKGKRKLFINISLIVLSLCVMVYGVYSAKQASLTVSGTIGFQAHNAVLQYSNVSVANALKNDGTAYSYTGTGSGDTKVDASTAIEFSEAMYFDDLTNSTASADNIPFITITLKVHNKSKFAVKMTDVSTATDLPAATTGTTKVDNVKYTATAAYTSGSSMAASTDGATIATNGVCTVTIKLIFGTAGTESGKTDKTYVSDAASAFAATNFAVSLAFGKA